MFKSLFKVFQIRNVSCNLMRNVKMIIMTPRINPFVISGYVSPEYFCDREAESAQLIREVCDGNNVALLSTRRMGKSGLIQHCFQKSELRDDYYTFFIDIYPTKSLREFVFTLSKNILESLKPS